MTNEVAEFDNQRAYRPARSPEQRELQMMELAMGLSEKRLQEGTASASEIVYWLNQASPKVALNVSSWNYKRSYYKHVSI